jgi:hypothetical protein
MRNRGGGEMRNFDWWIVYGLKTRELVWVRFRWGHYGISIKKTPKLFSERYGYVKYLPLPFGWRLQVLKATK